MNPILEQDVPGIDLYKYFNLFHEVGETRSRNRKAERMKLVSDDPAGNLFLRQAAAIMWDSYTTFGVTFSAKPALERKRRGTASPHTEDAATSWKVFKNILKALAERDLTGQTAKETLAAFFSKLPDLWIDWLCRIGNQNWAIGFNWSSLEELGVDLSHIPVHHVELCTDWDGEELSSPRLVEPKFDGLRGAVGAIHPYQPGKFLALSRNGLPFSNCADITEALYNVFSDAFVLDGEFEVEGADATTRRAKTLSILQSEGPHPDAALLRFHLFDIIPVEDYLRGRCDFTVLERKEWLKAMPAHGKIKVVPGVICSRKDAVEAEYARLRLDDWEGVVLKDPHGIWTGSRSGVYQRKKFMTTEDLVILDFDLGWLDEQTGEVYALCDLPDGKHPHGHKTSPIVRRLGLGYCEGSKVEVWVGTGFTDEQQRTWYENRNSLFGKVVEFKHYGKLAQGGRAHPVFREFRPDKNPQEIVKEAA